MVLVSWNLDTAGWLVRFVEDAALLLQVMAGPDAKDPVSSHYPVGDYLSAIADPPAPRIGLLRRYFYERADAETRRHPDAAEQLAQAGAEIEELLMPDSIETAYADRRLIMSVAAAAFHEPMYRRQAEDYQPKLRAMLADGLAVDGIAYFPRAGKPTAVHQRYGAAGAAVRHPADAGCAHAGTRRPHQHRRPGLSVAVAGVRTAAIAIPVRHSRIGPAAGHLGDSGGALRRCETAGRGGLVRGGAGGWSCGRQCNGYSVISRSRYSPVSGFHKTHSQSCPTVSMPSCGVNAAPLSTR